MATWRLGDSMTWRLGDLATLFLLAGCGTEPSIALVATPDSVVFSDFGPEPAPLTLQLASPAGDGAWSATSPAPWLAILPPSGSSLPARLTMTADANGKAGGTFRTTLTIQGPRGAVAVRRPDAKRMIP